MSPLEGSLEHSDKSRVYDALSNSRRRHVIRQLDDAEAPLGLRELAAALAEWEDGCEPGDRRVAEIQSTLYHIHVPKLSEAGIVRYNKADREVSLTDSVSLDSVELFDD
jgi:hypothetical protein